MKTFATLGFSLAVALLGQATPAAAQDVVHPTPSVGLLAGGGIGATPLVRYLAATLRLTQAQAAAVQEAVGKHQLQAHSPQQLAECLHQVLPADEFERFLVLQEDAFAYTSLRYLAMR